MKKEITPAYRHIFRSIALAGSLLLIVWAGSPPAARAQSAGVRLVRGTVQVAEPMQGAVVRALDQAQLSSAARIFAITDLQADGAWALLSVIGLAQVHAAGTWTIDDGSWTGLVLLHQQGDGTWQGATQGTAAFSRLLAATPDRFLSSRAKRDLDPRRQSGQTMSAATAFAFPWQPGTMMLYGRNGIHANGFNSVVSGWKAVDMMSDGDTGHGHAPNMLLAAEGGTITYRCKDSNNIAIHMGDFFYTHLANNAANSAALVVGASFGQRAPLGALKTGSFSGGCGYASQPAGWFHVHWGFPSGDLHVESWTLSMSSGDWTSGSLRASPGSSWIIAGSTDPCPAPTLSAPADAFVSTSQTLSFTWTAISGCTFGGYNIRIKTVATMDSGGTTVLNTTTSGPSYRKLIPSDWNKQDLYWGVRAAGAPFGASWSVRQIRIDPGNRVPTDYGLCAQEGQRCAFSGAAQLYFGASDHFIGPVTASEGIDCTNDAFGADPIPGTTKQCFIRGGRPEGTAWCANQNQTCSFGAGKVATVYFGANGKYNSKTNVTGSQACNATALGDPFPLVFKACYYEVIGSTATTQLLASTGAYDGWVLESGETSELGGTTNTSGYYLRLGDDELNRQLRSVLSFDTSVLDDNAVITSATLKVRKALVTGTNPFDTLGNILVDLTNGAFSGDPALEWTDFQAAADQPAALAIANSPVSGWYSAALSATNFTAIDKAGTTQFRLRFATDDNNNSSTDMLQVFSGDYVSTPAYRPRLVIGYYLPQVP